MSPFDIASALGYGKNDILKFLKKASPQLGPAITQAINVGYSAEEIFEFLSKKFAGMKVDPRVEKRVFQPANEASIMKQAQNVPGKKPDSTASVLGGLAGAGAGFLTGGPVGAALGGIVGYNELGKLTKAYENHIQQGGSIPFGEFLAKIAKGATLAGLAGSQLKPLQETAAAALQAMEGQQETPTPPPGPEGMQKEGVEEVAEMQAPKPDISDAAESVMTNFNMANFAKRLKDTGISNEDIGTTLKKYFGANRVREVEKRIGQPIEKIVEALKIQRDNQRGTEETIDQTETLISEPVIEESPELQKPVEQKQRQYRIEENPKAWSFEKAFTESKPTKDQKALERVRPFRSSLKSSNLTAATFDQDTGTMRILFQPREGRKGGDVYTYDNMDLETFNKMTGGEARPITEGSNTFGIWFSTKNPSIGASFDKFIKKNAEKFPYSKLEKNAYTVEEKAILEAQRAHLASDLFEPFAKQRTEGRRKIKGKEIYKRARDESYQGVLKEIQPVLKRMSSEDTEAFINYVEEKYRSMYKKEPTMTQLEKLLRKELKK